MIVSNAMRATNHEWRELQPPTPQGPRWLVGHDLLVSWNRETMAMVNDAPRPLGWVIFPNNRGLCWRTSLNAFENLFLGHFAIDDAFFRDEVLNLEFMSLFLVKNLVIMLNLDGPHDNAVEKMPNSNPSFVWECISMTPRTILSFSRAH